MTPLQTTIEEALLMSAHPMEEIVNCPLYRERRDHVFNGVNTFQRPSSAERTYNDFIERSAATAQLENRQPGESIFGSNRGSYGAG